MKKLRGKIRNTYSIVGSAQKRTVASNCDAGDGDVLLGDELVGTVVLGEIPDADAAAAVATDDLALVRVDDNVISRAAVVVAALYGAAASLPNLDSAVLARSDHPFSLAVESNSSDISGVALEGQQWVGIRRLDIK